MSGGHFHYSEYSLYEIIESIEHEIQMNNSTEINEYNECMGGRWKPETIIKFIIAKKMIRDTIKVIKNIDYLLSSDTNEDTFLEDWEDLFDVKK